MQGVQVERISREAGELTAEQREALLEDAPELAELLQELRGSLSEVRLRVGPLIKEVGGAERHSQIELCNCEIAACAAVQLTYKLSPGSCRWRSPALP